MTRDFLHTRLCAEYGCRYPIVALTLERHIAAAVTSAGGIGVYAPAYSASVEEVEADARWIAAQVGDRPWGIDLVIPAAFIQGEASELEPLIPQQHRDFMARFAREHGIPEPKTPPPYGRGRMGLLERARAKLDVILELDVPIFVAALGNPAFILERAHAQGTRVWGQIGLVRQARREVEAGVDLIVATGGDAGGHASSVGTFALLPDVVESVGDVPVLAAGGITHGRHLLAALAMGAVGVWTGTIWQATTESTVADVHKQHLLASTAEDAVLTRSRTGKQLRQLRSKWSEWWDQPGAPAPLPMPLQDLLIGKVLQSIEDWGLDELRSVSAGQGVGAIEHIRPVAHVIEDMVAEARAAHDRMLARETA